MYCVLCVLEHSLVETMHSNALYACIVMTHLHSNGSTTILSQRPHRKMVLHRGEVTLQSLVYYRFCWLLTINKPYDNFWYMCLSFSTIRYAWRILFYGKNPLRLTLQTRHVVSRSDIAAKNYGVCRILIRYIKNRNINYFIRNTDISILFNYFIKLVYMVYFLLIINIFNLYMFEISRIIIY